MKRNDSRSARPDLLNAFGARGAAIYDREVQVMPRHYRRAHAIQNTLVIDALRRIRAEGANVVVDLGAGTGDDGVAILSRAQWVSYLGIDRSPHMLERAANKMVRYDLGHRTVFLRRNFARLPSQAIKQIVAADSAAIGAVISSLALHHCTGRTWRGVYGLAYQLLPEGGLFVVTDLFTNDSPRTAGLALTYELNRIDAAVRRLRRRSSVTTMSSAHYRKDNKPPRLTEAVIQLRRCGFATVDVVFREGQLAVIAAERGR